MSLPVSKGFYRVEAAYADRLRAAGLGDALSVFEHPNIDVWRSITERENCVLDLLDTQGGGRLHIKRNKPGFRGVDGEVKGIRLLMNAGIGTVPLVAAGQLNDGRGFLITENLAGYADSEVLVKEGMPFESLLTATAALAGQLHAAGLHHRDLYLCHFYVRISGPLSRYSGGGLGRGSAAVEPLETPQTPSLTLPREYTGEGTRPPPVEVRLMDAGRVRPLPRWFRWRWIVKDVAQFVYSLRQLDIAEALIDAWLAAYAAAGGTVDRPAVERKVAWIGRHDAKLRQRQPNRNVAIDR